LKHRKNTDLYRCYKNSVVKRMQLLQHKNFCFSSNMTVKNAIFGILAILNFRHFQKVRNKTSKKFGINWQKSSEFINFAPTNKDYSYGKSRL